MTTQEIMIQIRGAAVFEVEDIQALDKNVKDLKDETQHGIPAIGSVAIDLTSVERPEYIAIKGIARDICILDLRKVVYLDEINAVTGIKIMAGEGSIAQNADEEDLLYDPRVIWGQPFTQYRGRTAGGQHPDRYGYFPVTSTSPTIRVFILKAKGNS